MTITSPYPDVDIPELTVFDALFASLTSEDEKRTALIDGTTGARLSFGSLRSQIEAFAGALRNRGVREGTVVGLQSPNSPEFVIAFHGVLRAGGTVTTVNSLATAEEVARQLEMAEAELMITVPALPGALSGAVKSGLRPEQVIMLTDDAEPEHPTLASLVGEGREAPELAIDPAEHIAVLPFSSGTTGRPKGVMLTHRNLVANLYQFRQFLPGRPGAVLQAVLPLFHIYGLTVLMNYGLLTRCAIVTMPAFDLEKFLHLIDEHRVTLSFIAPPIAVALAKHPAVEGVDLSSLEVLLCGAAPLDSHTAEQVTKRLGCEVRQGYGMTEMSPVSHMAPYGENQYPPGSIGPALPNTECRIVDLASGDDVEVPAEGESGAGELWCRGPMVMTGYLKDPASTSSSLDEDGYLHTGDIVTYDAGGWFTVVDRVKELIKVKGFQVAPAELEALLLEHPRIADAAVIGIPDESAGEVPKAFVVTHADESLSAEDVMEWSADRVSSYKRIRDVEFIDQIPKSASGKIMRRQLRAPAPPSDQPSPKQ